MDCRAKAAASAGTAAHIQGPRPGRAGAGAIPAEIVKSSQVKLSQVSTEFQYMCTCIVAVERRARPARAGDGRPRCGRWGRAGGAPPRDRLDHGPDGRRSRLATVVAAWRLRLVRRPRGTGEDDDEMCGSWGSSVVLVMTRISNSHSCGISPSSSQICFVSELFN